MSRPFACGRPSPEEYPEFLQGYIARVPEDDVLAVLEKQGAATLALLGTVPESCEDHRYAAGKWSIREVVGHLIDAERVFTYRALRFARGDTTPLPGFEEGDYVREAGAGACPLAGLALELQHVRRASILFFAHLPEAAWRRAGVANGKRVSVRALAFAIAGHERHHVQTLRERYLGTPSCD